MPDGAERIPFTAALAGVHFLVTAKGLAAIAAAQRVEEERAIARLRREANPTCPWCGHRITDDHAVRELGGRLVHNGMADETGPPCLSEFDAWANDEGAVDFDEDRDERAVRRMRR